MKLSSKALILAAVVALSLGFTGCGSNQEDSKQANAQETKVEQASVSVYVPNDDGSGLREEKVTMSKVAVQPIQVINELVKADGGRTFAQTERIYNVWFKGNTAVVEVNKAFAQGVAGPEATKLQVDALVKTLRKLDGIDSVQFAVDGEVVNAIGDIDVSKPLK